MTKSQANQFMQRNFLLETETAQVLYDQFAAPMPIIDYHNHLSPKDIAENRQFNNLTELWLEHDHYKWRAMRINGISEKYITGDATPFEKFEKWAETVPYTMRNPLYHWTHLELKNYFSITTLLNKSTAQEIYETCSNLLKSESYSTRGLLKRMNVEVVGTTDDPVDTLEHHENFAKVQGQLRMFPTFRPDKAYTIENIEGYNTYIDSLAAISKTEISTFDDLFIALSKRMDVFNRAGCRASDHGLTHLVFEKDSEQVAPMLFKKLRNREILTPLEKNQFTCAVLLNLSKMYHTKGWVQQFHIGAMRNNNTRLHRTLGADAGFDSIGDFSQATSLSRFFDRLDESNQLAKTIIYNSNPADNEVFATMIGNFNDGSSQGKVQYGSGWWFLDQKDGMEKQLTALSNMGLLSRFVGMITDSRSFLSFPRHEYFRRILCNQWGNDVEKGLLPNDIAHIGSMIQDICYRNAKNYFKFQE